MTNTEVYKIPCAPLDRILSLRKLTERQIIILLNKLRRMVMASKPGNLDVIQYVRLVISGVLTSNERKAFEKILNQYDVKSTEGWMTIRNILAMVYNAIVETYPELKIEYICGDVNGINGPDENSEEFKNFMAKSTKNRFNLETIEGINNLYDFLQENIIGQTEAVETVCNSLKLKSAGFCKRRVNGESKSIPLNLMFIGKSGTGKTSLARLLGEKYSNNFWIINCAEFSHGHEVNRLLGSPPGYVGGDKISALKEKSAKSNKWVIVFDEIEKGSDKLFNLLLSLMETGSIVDNMNNDNDFSESIIIFTTNSGVRDLKSSFINLGQSIVSKSSTKDDLEKSVAKDFSPEFRNRIDEFVFFNELTKNDAEQIAELRLKDYPVKRTKELIKFIVDGGFSEEFGAREVARFIKRAIALPLANKILNKNLPKDNGKYEFSISNGKAEIVNLTENKNNLS